MGPEDFGRLFTALMSFVTLAVLFPMALRPPLNLRGSFSVVLMRLAVKPLGFAEGGGFYLALAAPPTVEGALRFV